MAKKYEENTIKNEPFMYIRQPIFDQGSNMQVSYVVKPKKKKNDDNLNNELAAEIQQEQQNDEQVIIENFEVIEEEINENNGHLIEKLIINNTLEFNHDTPVALGDDSVELLEQPISLEIESEGETNKTVSLKPFHKMTIEEKINYLLYKPRYLPEITCRFESMGKTVVGKLVSEENGLLKIRPRMQLEFVFMNKEEIISIKTK